MARKKRSETREARRFGVILTFLLLALAGFSFWRDHAVRAAIVASTAGAVLVCYAATLVAVVLLVAPRLFGAIRRRGDQDQPLLEVIATRDEASLTARMLRFSSWAALAAVMTQMLQHYPMWQLRRMW